MQVRVTVSVKGKVVDAFVLESTNRMFDEPALAAARQLRFKPARKKALSAVRAMVMIPMHRARRRRCPAGD